MVEAEILRSYESGKNLSLSYNQGGVLCELELLTINTFPTELDAGRLYDFMVADGHNQGYKVVTVLIPRSRGKAVISVPW